MLIKNSLRLLINNLSLVFKSMLYRLVVLLLTYVLIMVVFRDIFAMVAQSSSFKAFYQDILTLWNSVHTGNFSTSVDLVSSFEAVMAAVHRNIGNYVWKFILIIFAGYLLMVIQSISTYTFTYMMNARMSTFEKKGFLASLIANLKHSLPFEALYTFIKIAAILASVSVGLLFVVYTINVLSIFSIIIGIWLIILLYAVFVTFTAVFRPLVINGAKFSELFKNRFSKSNFWHALASFVFTIFFIGAMNIMMFVCTFGAGTIISVPLSQILLVCIDLVLVFSLDGKRYYVDYETIEVPNKIKENTQNAEFIDDIDV